MAVQRWRWWQWILVSLLVGGVLGFVFTRLDIDDTSIATRDLGFLLRHLNQRTDGGESIVDAIHVSPPMMDVNGNSIENVTFWVRAKNKTTGKWDPIEQYQVRVGRPLFKAAKDPNYSIRDFLSEQKKDLPSLNYRYNFYQETRFIWAASIGGSVLGIGILWPMLIKAMVKLGLGLPESEEEEKGIDLRRVSSRTASTAALTGVSVNDADRDQLAALNDRLEANVSGMLMEQDQLDDEAERKAEAAVIKKLSGEALPADEITPANSNDPREYGGEFYPVARPVVKKKEDDEDE